MQGLCKASIPRIPDIRILAVRESQETIERQNTRPLRSQESKHGVEGIVTDVRILVARVKKLRQDKPQGHDPKNLMKAHNARKWAQLPPFARPAAYVQSILLVRQEDGKKGWHTIQEMGGLCAGKKRACQTRSCGSNDEGKQRKGGMHTSLSITHRPYHLCM